MLTNHEADRLDEFAEDVVTMGPDTTAAPDAPDEAREVLAALRIARQAEKRARDARTDYIQRKYLAGERPKDIARTLQEAADTLGLSPRERAAFGISESSVHHALTMRGVKE